MDGMLYDPSQEAPLPVDVPMMDNLPRTPTFMENVQNRVSQIPGQFADQFSNIQQQVGNNSDLFLAAAAGIGKGTPMGDMASSIQDHYKLQDQLKMKKDAQAAMLSMKQKQLDEQSRMNSSKIDANTAKALRDGTAKVTSMGGGVVAVTVPGASAPTMMTSDDYQNFMREQTQTKGEYGIIAAGAKLDATPKTAAQEKLEQEAQARVNGAQATINRYQAAKEMLKQQGAPELAGLPFVGRIAQILGTDSASAAQVLAQLKVDEGFTNLPHGQGSMSNLEREMLLAPVPSMDASTKVWMDYIDRRMPILEKSLSDNQGYYDKLTNQPKKGIETAKGVVQDMRAQRQPTPPVAAPVAPTDVSQAPPAAAAPVAPAPVARASAPRQAYPPGFNPPNNGLAPPEDRIAILQAELKREQDQPESHDKATNLAALHRQLADLGFKPQKPAAAAPASGGVPTFSSVDAVKAAIAAGKLKSGDVFMDPQGNKRKVH